MKCELCHTNDAETVLHQKKDGKDRELYVCKKCAAAARHPKKKKDGVPPLLIVLVYIYITYIIFV